MLSQSVWQVLQNVRCCNKTVSWRLLHPARNEYKVNMWAAACIWWGLLIGEQVWYLSWRDALAISIRNWIYCDAAAATVTTIQITTWLTYWMKAQSATRMKYYVRWIDMSSTVTSLHIRFITLVMTQNLYHFRKCCIHNSRSARHKRVWKLSLGTCWDAGYTSENMTEIVIMMCSLLKKCSTQSSCKATGVLLGKSLVW